MFYESNTSSFSINSSENSNRNPTGRKRSLARVRNLSHHSITDLEQHKKRREYSHEGDDIDNDRDNSAITAGFNVSNLIQGIGILGVPFAVSQSSYVSLIFIILAAYIACSTGIMLISCLYEYDNTDDDEEDNYRDDSLAYGIVNKKNKKKKKLRIRESYSDIGDAVWPNIGSKLVTTVSIIEMFGGNTLYIVLLSEVGFKLINGYFPDKLTIYWFSLIMGFIPLPLFFVRRLSIVSWFSFIAVIGLLGTIISLLVYCIYEISHGNLHWDTFKTIDLSRTPLSIGIITFSYCAHAAFVGVEGSMRRPSEFPTMMRVSFSLAAIMKLIMPLFVVLIFGSKTPQQCTLDIKNEYFKVIISIFVLINTIFSLPLTMFVVCERIDDAILPRLRRSFTSNTLLSSYWLIVTRSMVQSASLLMAMLIPHFAILMGFIGSITGSCLTYIFPPLFSIKLQYKYLTKPQIAWRVFIIILGIIFGISGTVVGIIEIIHTFK